MKKGEVFIVGIFIMMPVSLYSCTNGSKSNRVLSSKTFSIGDSAYLSIVPQKYNFGKVNRNNSPQFDVNFDIENKGGTLLVINKVDVSCGCLSVKYPNEPIFPGKKAQITIQIDTRKQIGRFNKSVFIRSNASNDPELLRIKGEIIE